jgi:ubiquinone biosynthesis protein COQ9
MEDAAFDRALVSAAFALAAEVGWHRVSVTEAARRAGLPLDRARLRFPGRSVVLLRLGRMADAVALADVSADAAATVRDRLFDLLMRRFDVLQENRDGVLALLNALPRDPATALLLATATVGSMHWMLEASGISAQGPFGLIRAKGLTAVWVQTVRAWAADRSPDLSGTMAALDKALGRAERMSSWLPAGRRAGRAAAPADEPASEFVGASEADPASMPPVPPAMPPATPPPTPPAPPPSGEPGASEADPGTLP